MSINGTMEKIILALALKHDYQWYEICNAIKNKEEVTVKEMKPIVISFRKGVFKNEKINYVTVVSPNYPEKLRTAQNPPFILFYNGDLDMLTNPTTRDVIIYGLRSEKVLNKACGQYLNNALFFEDGKPKANNNLRIITFEGELAVYPSLPSESGKINAFKQALFLSNIKYLYDSKVLLIANTERDCSDANYIIISMSSVAIGAIPESPHEEEGISNLLIQNGVAAMVKCPDDITGLINKMVDDEEED